MSKSLLDYPKALVNQVRRLAVEAGEATLDYFGGYRDADLKADGSPVTIADRKAEEIIVAGLQAITPGIPVIAEESFAAGEQHNISGIEYFWLVDPLDGTREFIGGSGEYTVNIALIHKGEPLLGVVYAPAADELFAACGPDSAIRFAGGREKAIKVRHLPRKGLAIVVSRHHGDPERLDEFLKEIKVSKLLKKGSSLKICAIAAGKADLYPRFGRTSEWDTAAGHAILRAAGGDITDFSGRPLVYGRNPGDFGNPEFLAFSDRSIIAALQE